MPAPAPSAATIARLEVLDVGVLHTSAKVVVVVAATLGLLAHGTAALRVVGIGVVAHCDIVFVDYVSSCVLSWVACGGLSVDSGGGCE